MRFNDYQELANQTDQQPGSATGLGHYQLLLIPLMGLAGEVGELLSEQKKWLRDGKSYQMFPDRVKEELGDLLWYLSNVATKQGFRLGETALGYQHKASALWWPTSELPPQPNSKPNTTDIELNEFQEAVNWADQRPQQPTCDGDPHQTAVPLFRLVGTTASLLNGYAEWFEEGTHYPLPPDQAKEQLGRLIWHLTNVAFKHGLYLEDVAQHNLEKIDRRWGPLSSQRSHYRLFDEEYEETERLPRQMDIIIKPDGSGRTVTFVNGKRFGDSLSDNRYEDDGYRYHDIFHLCFASILGWSPTVRALLRRKRKSNPLVDETEDGGRAMVLEEGISAFVFDYAARRNFLDGVKTVDYKLLRNIRELTEHLEVARCTEADWERAIVTGFQIWREVRAKGRGHLCADLEKGTIWVAEAPPTTVIT